MGVTRRLVAIFYADVAGYSRLTGADEEGTHRRVMAVLDEVTARIADAGGEVLRYAGDAVLATFPSAVLAVETAATIQTVLAEREAGQPAEGRVQIRIGINVGDVIEDRGEVYGEGVNLAARLEAAASPGGLCISASTHEQCRRKTVLTFRDGGAQAFKNIDGKVHVWHWTPEVVVAAVEGLPALRDKTSIAVLPFDNMSGDPEQAYFSDGITEDLITALSRFRHLKVAARNSAFVFKGQAVDIAEAGKKLGVRYVVEGSVRKAGNRIRVTAQLIDAANGAHVWAERFDRDLTDIFEVQDEIVAGIAAQLGFRLVDLISSDVRTAPTESVTSYDHFLQGRAAWRRGDAQETVEQYRKAAEIDPKNATALASLAFFYAEDVWTQSLGMPIPKLVTMALEHANTAVALNDGDAFVSHMVGSAYTILGDLEHGYEHLQMAVRLNPHFTYSAMNLGLTVALMGRHEEGLALTERAMKLEPRVAPAMHSVPMTIHYLMGDYESAIVDFHRTENPFAWQYLLYAVFLAQAGRLEEAHAARETFERQAPPAYDVAGMIEMTCRTMRQPEDKEHWREGFRKAGIIP